MDMSEFEIISPYEGMAFNAIEALGAAVWLFMHSKRHQELAVADLSGLLVPAIKRGQFFLLKQQGQPIGYVAWAWFDETTEREYFHNPQMILTPDQWQGGDRLWILDWVAPFGHCFKLAYYVKSQLFADRAMRFLSRPKQDGRVALYQTCGRAADTALVKAYFSQRPVSG